MSFKVLDSVSRSPELFGLGTSKEYTHPITEGAIPRAVLVFIMGFEKNAIDVTAVTYGQKTLTKEKEAIPGTTPFPYVAVWFADAIEPGNQVVKITKNNEAKVRVVTVTLNAPGAISVVGSAANSGTNTAAGVTKLEPGGDSRYCLGMILAKTPASKLVQRATGMITSGTDGEMYWEVNGAELPKAIGVGHEWTWESATLNARLGIMLSVPGMVVPTGRVFTADGAPGLLTQFTYLPCNADKIRVIQQYRKWSPYTFIVERNEGEPLVASGNRNEAQTGLTYASGTERWFEFWRLILNRDAVHWLLFWQLHDQSGGSPPVCLIEENGELYYGPGAGTDWWSITKTPKIGKWAHYKAFVKMHATEGAAKLWINNNLVVSKTGKNTLGEGPVYDKIGIYRSSSSEGLSKTIFSDYYVSNQETEYIEQNARLGFEQEEGNHLWRNVGAFS